VHSKSIKVTRYVSEGAGCDWCIDLAQHERQRTCPYEDDTKHAMMMRHAMPSVRLLSSLSGEAPARQLGPLLLLLLSGLNFDHLHRHRLQHVRASNCHLDSWHYLPLQ
jgi:hypothetical protein